MEYLLIVIIAIIIIVAILRWVLRINHIVDRLDRIAEILLEWERQKLLNSAEIKYKRCPKWSRAVKIESSECYYCNYNFSKNENA